MLQLALELQEVADGQLALEVGAEEVGGEGRAAAARLERVARGGAVAVAHAHAGLGADDALDLQGGRSGKTHNPVGVRGRYVVSEVGSTLNRINIINI